MNSAPRRSIIIGTRTSRLARWQAEHIQQRLQAVWPGLVCTLRPFVTKGDKTLDRPLPEIGGKGLFTAELERALSECEIDIAVHSLKDLPIEDVPGLTLGAVSSRADVRDTLVASAGWTLETLPTGAVVGTSSLRRQAQLLAMRPDLWVTPIRGNIDTRVRKVQAGEYDAAVLAAAGLERLGLAHLVTQWLDLAAMLPAPGQGALAVQCRAYDGTTLALLAMIDDAEVRLAVTAERTFLSELGGGCSAPVAAHATVDGSQVTMRGCVATPDGKKIIRVAGSGRDAWALGSRLAKEAFAQGAGDLMTSLSTDDSPQRTGNRPLQGRRIVVTRARGQARALSRKLANLGATPLEIPMIQIAPMADSTPIDRAVNSLGTYDWVVFTSVNGVKMFWPYLASHPDVETLITALPKVAAVGPATARALIERGVRPAFTPDRSVSEAIIAGIGYLSGLRILLPRAQIARKSLPEMLVAGGAIVDDLPVYRTLSTRMDESNLAELNEGVDVVVFTSGSTARNWAKSVGVGDRPYLVACVGPVTAEAASNVGLGPDIVASEYTTDGIVDALVRYFVSEKDDGPW